MPLKKTKKLKSVSSKKIISKSRFSRSVLLVFCLVFGAVGGYLIWRGLAAPGPPTVYLSPASQTFNGTTSFSVQVRENSGTTAVNAIQANLTYNASLIDFVSIDTTNSAFATQAQNTGGAGTVNIARGTCGGCSVTGDQLVATINFKTKTTTGGAAIAFASGTALVSSSTNQDILGGLNATAGGTYTVDVTPPAVSITAPVNNATLAQGSTVTVTANASDANSSISKVEFYVDGTLKSTVAASPYNYSWGTSGLALGAHTLQAKAYDAVGNVTASTVTNVTLADQTAPSAPASFRSAGSTLNGISLAWNASTDNIGVANYKLSRAGTVIATLTSTTLTYADSGLMAGTAYSYSLVALDADGNVSTAATLNASTSAVTPGDVNADGHVNINDLSIMLSRYGTSDSSCDIDKSGTVDVVDLSTLLSHYGT